MSLLTPERVPVKVYKWDDVGAPKLDKTAGCVSTIFKACLVTGYGDKAGAGWAMPFEDTENGVKVFSPPESPDTNFYLQVSKDTGQQITARVYLNMIDASTGDLKLQCDTPFKYAVSNATGKWVLIVSAQGLWFFNEITRQGFSDSNKTGAFFTCGNTARNTVGDKAIYLHHSGGSWGEWMLGLLPTTPSVNQSIPGKIYSHKLNTVMSYRPQAIFNGRDNLSTNVVLSQLCVFAFNDIYLLPAYMPSVCNKNNYDIVSADNTYINHSDAQEHQSNVYIQTDHWTY